MTWAMVKPWYEGHRISEPWFCIGDYNDILIADEKGGGQPNSFGRMQLFLRYGQ